MAYINNFSRNNNTSAQVGLTVGILWGVSFVCVISNVSPILTLMGMIISIVSIYVTIQKGKGYRDTQLGGEMSFIKAFSYSLNVFICASIIMALCQWMYLEFIDKGAFIQEYMAQTRTAEFKQALKSAQIDKKEFMDALRQVAAMRPIDIALQFLTTNISFSLFLAIFCSLMIKRK